MSTRDHAAAEPYDYVVVGAGSAGCVVASRLAEDRDVRVLVLEAGSHDYSPYLQIPAGRIRMNPKHDWSYPAVPDPSRGGRGEDWESGRVLGGSSSINGMIWVRGPAEDYDRWAELGCTGWDYNSVLPYFRRGETFEGGANKYRGNRGPQRVSFQRVSHPLTDEFIESAVLCGHPRNPDYNGARPDGVSLGQLSQRRGLRHSAARAYLWSARRRPNLTVRTDAFATRVLFDGNRAVGVEFRHRGALHRRYGRREVILAAGAVGTPKLLLLSGVGPADHLDAMGIDCVVDRPAVGSNLQNHLYLTMVAQVDVPTLNREITPRNVARHGLDLLLRGRGAATSALGHAMVFGSLGHGRVDFQGIFAPYGLTAEKENGRARDGRMSPMRVNAVTIRVGLMRPAARGVIRLRSADPADSPIIDYRSLADPGDVADMIAACREMRRILRTRPLADHVVAELAPGPDVTTDAEWGEVIRSNGIVGKHAAGSCAMGTDPATAVADPQLRVHGTEGLRIVDLSITPVIVSGNTNAAAMMIGERGSSLVGEATRSGAGTRPAARSSNALRSHP